jgi:micrococcal nuclease
MRRRSLPWLLVVALAAALGIPRLVEDGSSGAAPVADGPARVVRVVDGDTIVVDLAGRQERVRYIGVDTPESVKPNAAVECFGKRAAAENRRLVEGQRVRLAGDVEPRDRFGRVLAYVTRDADGLFVNAELVRRGYATVLTIAPNVRHAARFVALAREARRAGRGLWTACER